VRPERARQPGPAEFRLDVWSRNSAASQCRIASNRWAAVIARTPGKCRLRPFPEPFLSDPLATVIRGSAEAVVVLMDLDELVDHWTLLKDEQELVAGKRGPTRLGFAVLLKFYARAGRFPRGRAELDDDAVAFVARQVGVPASDLGFYEWAGSTIEYHRAQIRRHLGFRECTAEDAGKLTEWLAASVCQAERRADRVREELLAHCRTGQIEPPSAGRCDRIIRSALHQAEQTLTARVTARLGPDASARLAALAMAADDDDEADGGEPSALALIKSVPRQREPGIHAHRDRQAGRGPGGRAARWPVLRYRDEGGHRLASPRRGGSAVAPARSSPAADADPACRAGARAAAGDH
jgi:hypothetical protein